VRSVTDFGCDLRNCVLSATFCRHRPTHTHTRPKMSDAYASIVGYLDRDAYSKAKWASPGGPPDIATRGLNPRTLSSAVQPVHQPHLVASIMSSVMATVARITIVTLSEIVHLHHEQIPESTPSIQVKRSSPIGVPGMLARAGVEATYMLGSTTEMFISFVNYTVATNVDMRQLFSANAEGDPFNKALIAEMTRSMAHSCTMQIMSIVLTAMRQPGFTTQLNTPGILNMPSAATQISDLTIGKSVGKVRLLLPNTNLSLPDTHKVGIVEKGFVGSLRVRMAGFDVDTYIITYNPSGLMTKPVWVVVGRVLNPPETTGTWSVRPSCAKRTIVDLTQFYDDHAEKGKQIRQQTQFVLAYGNCMQRPRNLTKQAAQFVYMAEGFTVHFENIVTKCGGVENFYTNVETASVAEPEPADTLRTVDRLCTDFLDDSIPGDRFYRAIYARLLDDTAQGIVKGMLSDGFYPGSVIVVGLRKYHMYPSILFMEDDRCTLYTKRLREGILSNSISEEQRLQLAQSVAVGPPNNPANVVVMSYALVQGEEGSNEIHNIQCVPVPMTKPAPHVGDASYDPLQQAIDGAFNGTDVCMQTNTYFAFGCLSMPQSKHFHSTTGKCSDVPSGNMGDLAENSYMTIVAKHLYDRVRPDAGPVTNVTVGEVNEVLDSFHQLPLKNGSTTYPADTASVCRLADTGMSVLPWQETQRHGTISRPMVMSS
jgi:hypothetical protein